jgi:hypothetical protein
MGHDLSDIMETKRRSLPCDEVEHGTEQIRWPPGQREANSRRGFGKKVGKKRRRKKNATGAKTKSTVA